MIMTGRVLSVSFSLFFVLSTGVGVWSIICIFSYLLPLHTGGKYHEVQTICLSIMARHS